MGKKSAFRTGVTTIKTSLALPEDLWRAAKIRAIHEGKNLQDIVAEALREHLKTKGKEDKK
jgi:hypothetical protein